MRNTISRINLRNVTNFQKFVNKNFKKIFRHTQRKFLPAWNFIAFYYVD